MPRSHFPAAVLVAALLSSFGAAQAADFHVDPAAGVDDLGLADGSALQPWRTLGFALAQVPDTGRHVVHLAAGEYSAASGETLPHRLPANLSLHGDPAGGTVLVDERGFSAPTVYWFVVAPDSLDAGNALRDLTIERRLDGGPAGRGLSLSVRSTSATPTLENLVITGAQTGIDLLVDGDSDDALLAPVISNCVLAGNQVGLLATAYTYSGASSAVDPVLTNTVLADNVDGAVFETTAAYGLSPGNRRNATSRPVLEHVSVADNLGSGVLLDDTNLGFGAAGSVRPAIRNSILSAAGGDFAVNEFSNTSFPQLLENNLLEASLLGFYLDDGLFELQTIDEVNSLGGSAGNFAGSPLFVRELRPGWRLRPDSPGVDAATPSALAEDFEGEARPVDSDGDGLAVSEVGADEAPNCAVTAAVQPAEPEPRCGVYPELILDAGASGITPGFPGCSVPLEFQWYFDGEELLGETGTSLATTPERTGVYRVRVRCPDAPHCEDTAGVPVVVHGLPTADPGSDWSACLDVGDDRVVIDLAGTAEAPPGASIVDWAWSTTSPYGGFLGSGTPTPLLEVSGYTDFEHLDVDVTLTVVDSNGCAAASTELVRIWRAPQVALDGPFVGCMSEGAVSSLPLAAMTWTPPGTSIVGWEWTTNVGRIDDPSSPTPSLIRENQPFPIFSRVSLRVTDDQGCTTVSEEAVATFYPSPSAQPGGPYQLVEDPGGTTSFALDGSSSEGGAGTLSHAWTTDLGTFVPPSADAAMVQLDIVNTGVDQAANVCLTVTDENGCSHEGCTVVSVKASPLQPPNDVGDTLRVAKLPPVVRLVWSNSPIDGDHDLARTYEIWQSSEDLPDAGGWTLRVADIAQRPGVTRHEDPDLLDLAGADLIRYKVVARNSAGASCVNPPPPRVTLDPDCLP